MSARIDTIAPTVVVSNFDPTLTTSFGQSFGDFLMSEVPGLISPGWFEDGGIYSLEHEAKNGTREELLRLILTSSLGMEGALAALRTRKSLKKADPMAVVGLVDERELSPESTTQSMKASLLGCANQGILKGLLVIPSISAEFASNWSNLNLGKGFGIFNEGGIAVSPAFGSIVANYLIRNSLIQAR